MIADSGYSCFQCGEVQSFWFSETGNRIPIPDSRFPTPYSLLPIPDSRFPIPYSLYSKWPQPLQQSPNFNH
ncbi:MULTISPECIES: hypothetical protein [unclassified Moorena]|uniref:hypothetical protein n=1 Tax=unclassified Moorena TaxID=2683338 RepID=UPI0013F825EB|nr:MULTISPECIES: hypothetical protein [unclassified Moorena]NEO16604.1 hypothetical protein [Moorena sp. SIO3E8]NEP29139.1 hypothetical protein [Moorena sp. SIO3I6]NEQ03288.1 hypothetical protein [Moorena sp. SIO3F7]